MTLVNNRYQRVSNNNIAALYANGSINNTQSVNNIILNHYPALIDYGAFSDFLRSKGINETIVEKISTDYKNRINEQFTDVFPSDERFSDEDVRLIENYYNRTLQAKLIANKIGFNKIIKNYKNPQDAFENFMILNKAQEAKSIQEFNSCMSQLNAKGINFSREERASLWAYNQIEKAEKRNPKVAALELKIGEAIAKRTENLAGKNLTPAQYEKCRKNPFYYYIFTIDNSVNKAVELNKLSNNIPLRLFRENRYYSNILGFDNLLKNMAEFNKFR